MGPKASNPLTSVTAALTSRRSLDSPARASRGRGRGVPDSPGRGPQAQRVQSKPGDERDCLPVHARTRRGVGGRTLGPNRGAARESAGESADGVIPGRGAAGDRSGTGDRAPPADGRASVRMRFAPNGMLYAARARPGPGAGANHRPPGGRVIWRRRVAAGARCASRARAQHIGAKNRTRRRGFQLRTRDLAARAAPFARCLRSTAG
jgi:hypothetical protein